jgi:hypothetical protein
VKRKLNMKCREFHNPQQMSYLRENFRHAGFKTEIRIKMTTDV